MILTLCLIKILKEINMKESHLFVLGLGLRLAFLIYGEFQDRYLELKYTDIDYKVYSDATYYVSISKSPYLRHTYRYTPLLAYILLPNLYLPWFGKLIFISADLLAAFIMSKLLLLNNKNPLYNAIWLLNPLVFNISTRGSSDSISSLLILLTIYFLQTKKIIKAALFFGLAVHFRIYPIIYSLIFYFWADLDRKRFFTKNRVVFTAVSASVFLGLALFFYLVYGFEFLYETYLFHFLRKDNRHNFSIYFYPLYLTYTDSAKLVGLLAFIPQWGLITYLSLIKLNPYTSILAVTFVFVIFNKVCTAQYFIWYITLLPISLPVIDIQWKQGVGLIIPWILSEFHWLYWGYRLEMLGENVFLQLWIASIIFFIANLRILTSILGAYEKKVLKVS